MGLLLQVESRMAIIQFQRLPASQDALLLLYQNSFDYANTFHHPEGLQQVLIWLTLHTDESPF